MKSAKSRRGTAVHTDLRQRAQSRKRHVLELLRGPDVLRPQLRLRAKNVRCFGWRQRCGHRLKRIHRIDRQNPPIASGSAALLSDW